MFTAKSVLEDITDHVGPMDPPTDLINVKKDVLLKYISDLRSKLRGKDEAIEKLSETFQKTISGIIEKNKASITEPLHEDITTIKEKIVEISSLSKPVSLPSSPGPVSKPKEVGIKAYEELALNFLDETHLESIGASLENMEYRDINKQREVCYMGNYKYKYTGAVSYTHLTLPTKA